MTKRGEQEKVTYSIITQKWTTYRDTAYPKTEQKSQTRTNYIYVCT